MTHQLCDVRGIWKPLCQPRAKLRRRHFDFAKEARVTCKRCLAEMRRLKGAA